jgi:hypothetical protein
MPWYDFQRGFFKVGEVMSGNYYWWGSEDTQYWNCNVSANNANLKDMSYSLWTVNAYANTIYDKLKGANASASVKSACMGECLTWKAMAYFYLVRTFGAVPIIHNNTDIIGAGTYNDQYKANIEDVYDYIIMTLKKAIELLPEKDPTGLGRIDKYSAEGLLAKVYLTKSGFDPATTTYEQGSVLNVKLSKDGGAWYDYDGPTAFGINGTTDTDADGFKDYAPLDENKDGFHDYNLTITPEMFGTCDIMTVFVKGSANEHASDTLSIARVKKGSAGNNMSAEPFSTWQIAKNDLYYIFEEL